jgi:hypothetical protein
VLADEDALTAAIIALARRFGRYGYRRITDLLQRAGRLAGQRQARAAHLAGGRLESALQTAEKR